MCFVAVKCSQGHKRAVQNPTPTVATTASCPEPGCHAPPVPVPALTGSPYYQTIRLLARKEDKRMAYSPQRDVDALDLFQLVRKAMLPLGCDLAQAAMASGSYSIRSRPPVGRGSVKPWASSSSTIARK